MKKDPLQCWVIILKDGRITAGHCVCPAGYNISKPCFAKILLSFKEKLLGLEGPVHMLEYCFMASYPYQKKAVPVQFKNGVKRIIKSIQ